MSKWLGVGLIVSLLVGASAGVTEASVYVGTGSDCDCYALDIGPYSVIGYSPSYPDGFPLSTTGTIDMVFVEDGGVVNLAGGYIEFVLYVEGGEVHITAGSVGMYVAVTGGVVTVYGTDFAEYAETGSTPLTEGSWIPTSGWELLVGEYVDGDPEDPADDINLWFDDWSVYVYLVDPTPSGPMPISIDFKPCSADNTINLRSRGVIPVAILSAADFDATALPPENIFFAGAPVCRYGRSDRYAARDEDVNGDGLVDLVVLVKTRDLQFDSEWFEDGGAYLAICEEPDPDSAVLGLGWDEITIVQPRCKGPWSPRWHGKRWSGKSVGRPGPKKPAGPSGRGKGRR